MKDGVRALLVVLGVLMGLACCVCESQANTAVTTKAVGGIQVDSRPCAFFLLNGVSEADPIVPGSPWYAISTSDANFPSLMSVLLTAKASGQTVNVTTDGSTACSLAHATLIMIN